MQMCSLQRGRRYVETISLADAAKFKDFQVYKFITQLPQSTYRGKNPKMLEKELTPAAARRYLNILLIMNTKEKSRLKKIDEISSNKE